MIVSRPLDDHLSDMQLDDHLASLVDGDGLPPVLAHVQQCTDCARRLGQRAAQREAFLARAPSWQAFLATRTTARSLAGVGNLHQAPAPHPPSTARRKGPSRSGWLAAGVAAAGVAAAAAASLMLAPEMAPPTDAPAGLRSKGSAAELRVYVKHGVHVREASMDDEVAAGDAVGFAVRSHQAAYFALLHRDATSTTLLQPETPGHAQATMRVVTPGAERALDFSFVLDGAQGFEEFLGLFCPQPLSTRALTQWSQHPEDLPAQDCSLKRVRLTKAAPPS